MSRIFDNALNRKVDDAINEMLATSGIRRADFCVGYFNLRGWKLVANHIESLKGCEIREKVSDRSTVQHRVCRLLIGMHSLPAQDVQATFNKENKNPDNEAVSRLKRTLFQDLRRQLTLGYQTNEDEIALRQLKKQLQEKKVVVKVHLRYPLHAKLYLAYREEPDSSILSIMGSSNLTFNGLYRNGELNAEFLDQNDAQQFASWFKERWEDRYSLDITDDLIKILDESWASENHPTPYEIYLKIMYFLGQEALRGTAEYQIPRDFKEQLYDFQATAVQLVLRHLKKRGGAMLGDVVGLGKTISACAVAKYYEERLGASTLILCPPNLIDMWKSYADKYDLKVKVESMAKSFDPRNERFYKLIIIDESHNLRNSGGKRYSLIRDLIDYQDNDVLLLTATPYNKDYSDIAAQLRLFIDPDEDLGMRPERAIKKFGGEQIFVQNYPNFPITSIQAFEKSEFADDWRDLMKLYLVRRTRTFIKNNYALPDEKDPSRRYLLLKNGERNYFPTRVPKTIRFETKPGDSFERLYSETIMDDIGSLSLPRYGLEKFISKKEKERATEKELEILNNLTSAGQRLRGFCRSGFCKRMDSSGVVFLMSLYRHAVRNSMFLYAIKNKLDIPIRAGVELDEGWLEDEDENGELIYSFPTDNSIYADKGCVAYNTLCAEAPASVKWISSKFFTPSLAKRLNEDNEIIFSMIEYCRAWSPKEDNKLIALKDLITTTHANEKVLIFTQYKDTARYLKQQLDSAGVKALDQVDGDTENMTARVFNFSPRSNHQNVPENETRVLIATDTLSEGQNLQDAHIIINYDLPWAIIRLIQRAGRVDRIGQKAADVLCYSFFPQEGVDQIIHLTDRLNERINNNAEAVGSDEIFFEGNKQNLKDIFNEKSGILDESDDKEVDLASHAYQIWQDAIKGKAELEERIKSLANVVYATKPAEQYAPGVITYARTASGNDILSWYTREGTLATQSFSEIIDALACTPETPNVEALPNHHELVKDAIEDLEGVASSSKTSMGVMGSKSSPRWKLFNYLQIRIKEENNSLFADLYQKIANEVYQYPLREYAKTTLQRMMLRGESTSKILNQAEQFFNADELCARPNETAEGTMSGQASAQVICSMGLS